MRVERRDNPRLPLFLFVVLFGLSMDYHVFILTRVTEAFDRGMSTEAAVAHAVKARIIRTEAAGAHAPAATLTAC